MTMATDNSLVHTLNDAQIDAVHAPLGKLLVLAGAGSGKTRVLVHRIAWLLEHHHVSPYSILAVTFTNKAAGEMRARIETLLGRSIAGMWVGTFHSLAHRLLRAHWRDANLPEHFQIIDTDDQYRLVKRLMKELGIDDTKHAPRTVQWYINAKKDEGLRVSQLQDTRDVNERTLIKIYQAYEEACTRAGLVDFAELLLRAHELWSHHAELLQHYQQRFRHILIDEFQDTNTIQYAWISTLTTPETDLMIVGDDDQSIYGWRGAKIENIHQFSNDFDNVQTIRLEQNYRSTSVILQAANALIQHNESRLGKNLWTNGDTGDLITVYSAYNERDEAHYIVNCIRDWLSKDACRRDIAILYRSNAQSRVLEEALLQADLPYRVYGGMRFFERAEIKSALAYLRLAVNRDDDAAFERIVNLPTRGIGERSLFAIRDIARTRKLSLWQASQCIVAEKTLAARACSAIEKFAILIDRLTVSLNDIELAEQIEQAISISGLLQHYQQERGETARARVENLEELVSAARQFQLENDDHRDRLLAFLTTATLESGEQQAQDNQDCIQLMTLHSAKGLEFPIVFLAGMEEGLFPHFMSASEPNRLEEERRLCYVGMTRAKKHLYLSFAETRRQRGSETRQRPSRFIDEIPKECINEVRPRANITRPMSHYRHSQRVVYAQSSATKSTYYSDEEVSLRIGQRVKHKKFGAGTIINIEGSGHHTRIQIRFESGDSKWLVASYVELET